MKKILQRVTAFIFRLLFQFSFRFDLIPFSDDYGASRGGSLARVYISRFLQKYAPHVRGRVLEFGSRKYESFFARDAITSYDVLDLSRTPESTVTGDIQCCPQIPDASFDAIICTQVLEHVFFKEKALSEMFRLLRPEGILLVTVPFNGFIHADPDDYWRYTPAAFERLLKNFDFKELIVEGAGNVFTSTLYNLRLGMADASSKMLDFHGSSDPLIVTCFARK